MAVGAPPTLVLSTHAVHKETVRTNIASTCLIVALVIICSCGKGGRDSELAESPAYLRRFFSSATNELDPVQLLEWGQNLTPQGIDTGTMLPREKWPRILAEKKNKFGNPSWVSVTTNQSGMIELVMIEYAGGFGQMGIAIIPSKEPLHSTARMEFIRWIDGVYIYNSP